MRSVRASRHRGSTPPPGSLPTRLLAAGIPAAQMTSKLSDRVAYAHDASHYLLTPEIVVRARSGDDVAALFRASTAEGVPLAFRAGGTSLSGQAGTDGILVDVRRHFRGVHVLDDGGRVRVGPGTTLREVNQRLAPYARRVGPDPASEVACTIGGVIANNSSGMTCGVTDNAFHTLDSLRLVLPSGTSIDTGAPDAAERLRQLEPELYEGLARLRARILGDAESVRRIRHQFSMKNTMGYSLNAFLEHDDPLLIAQQLVVGSEGTLAFIAEATMRTVPVRPHAATGLVLYASLAEATAELPAIVASQPAAVELLDAGSLRAAQRGSDVPPELATLDVSEHAALLVEYQHDSVELLGAQVRSAVGAMGERWAGAFADDTSRARLWAVRKGLYATVAAARPSGTIALLEDVVVPVPRLLAASEGLGQLFRSHGYHDAVVFGHAKDGNLHFMLTDRFDEPSGRERYRVFTEELVDLVLGEHGSLKAEHGTGRNMAPFVARQYGAELYDVMREVKRLFDPTGLLAPGVLLDDDPEAHLRHLKSTPVVEAEVDRCVECGYCEPVCPSQDLTLTPRQRIALHREVARSVQEGDEARVQELRADYDHDVLETCAVDGMCATRCPVAINTGDLVKRLRRESNGPLAEQAWSAAARHWDASTRGMASLLDVAQRLPERLPITVTSVARRALGADNVPAWSPDLPGGGRRRGAAGSPEAHPRPDAVLFASCTGTMFGAEGGTDGLGATRAFATLCERAGLDVAVLEDAASLCCGTPWRSKGHEAGLRRMRADVASAVRAASPDHTIPLVVDAASCTEGLTQLLEEAGLGSAPVSDAVTFTLERLLPLLTVHRREPRLVLHPTCSSTRLGIDADLRALAAMVADEVVVPDTWGCCGFAGDRGMLHPELTAAATARQAEELNQRATSRPASAHASCNRTCEIGMSRATGEPYEHLVEVVERATRPFPSRADVPEESS